VNSWANSRIKVRLVQLTVGIHAHHTRTTVFCLNVHLSSLRYFSSTGFAGVFRSFGVIY